LHILPRLALLALATGLTIGCDAISVAGIATPEGDARAQRVLRELIAGQRDSIPLHAHFGTDTAATAVGLARLDSILRGRQVDSLQLIGANRWSANETERLTLSYEFRTERGWLGAAVTTLDSAGAWTLIGLHVEPLAGELAALNRFHLTGRGLAQYLGLLLVLVCAGISLGTAVFIATRRDYPKRWRWVALSLVGASAVYVNWTTGEVTTRLLTMQLFSASMVRPSVYAPWLLSFSFPIGALVALQRYRQRRELIELITETQASVRQTVLTIPPDKR
jgi:hypothetical protein